MKNIFKKHPINSRELFRIIVVAVKKMLWGLGTKAFFWILIFIILDVMFGEYLFYRYVFLVRTKEPEVNGVAVRFNQNIYQSVVRAQQEREAVFENSSVKNYIDPFY